MVAPAPNDALSCRISVGKMSAERGAVLDIDNWLALAEGEADRTLHKFNYERERSFGAPYLTAAHAAFADFLLTVDDSAGLTADEMLASFFAKQAIPSRLHGAPPPDARFTDPPVRNDSRQVFLKHLGLAPALLDHLGFDPLAVQTCLEEVSAQLRAASSAPSIPEAVEEQLQSLVESLVPDPAPPAHIPSKLLLPVAGRVHLSAPPLGLDTSPWWFTYEDSLHVEELQLPEAAAPLERSGYVAGLRATLGLSHASDRDPDAVAASGGWRSIQFRVLFQLALRFDASLMMEEAKAFNQPSMFSGGFCDLFVTHPKSHDGGRTVRLRMSGCSHTTAGCQCADDGLPEGVAPNYVVMGPDITREVRGVFLVLQRDLSRYEKPTCDEIRAKRGVV